MAQVAPRVATGTPGLDKMLDGGLLQGRIYLVEGPPGSGKTMVSVQFLLEGVKRGEKVLMISLDESPAEIRENLGMLFGSSFEKIRVLDATLEMKSYERTPVRDVSIQRQSESFGDVFPEIPRSADLRNPELTASAVQEIIKNEVLEHKINRLVIDSGSGLKSFLLTNSDQNQYLQSFFRFLGDLPTTTLVTIQESNYPEIFHRNTRVEDVMAAGIIRLHRWLQNNGFRLGITVDKMRGSKHDSRMRPVRISNIGLSVYDRRKRGRGGE